MSREDELKLVSNSNVLWKIRRKKELRCSFCPPHKAENYTRHPREDKYKNINRATIRRYWNEEIEES